MNAGPDAGVNGAVRYPGGKCVFPARLHPINLKPGLGAQRGWARRLLNRARDLTFHCPAHRGANCAAMPTDEDGQDGHFFFNHPEREGYFAEMYLFSWTTRIENSSMATAVPIRSLYLGPDQLQ